LLSVSGGRTGGTLRGVTSGVMSASAVWWLTWAMGIRGRLVPFGVREEKRDCARSICLHIGH
jgi:hypothetical protein